MMIKSMLLDIETGGPLAPTMQARNPVGPLGSNSEQLTGDEE